MKIKCEHPNIIFNPSLKYLVCCKGFVEACFNGVYVSFFRSNMFYNFPWRDFYGAKNAVTLDNLDNFYLINGDGECAPVFMAVGCGKCKLCRQRKVTDWETRCICESASSKYPPLFITLTYAPDKRPVSSEECKRDFQLFMKRLRQNVSRHLGVKDSELRYFARSEKTPKNKYWHIHFLLWNMPFVSAAEGDRNSFQTLINFIQKDCWQNGITRVERCKDVSGAYVLKYELKDDSNPDYWQLASRRNGIGNKYALSMLPTVLKNPDMTSFSVVVNGKLRKCAIPSYFKRIWFPTVSTLFPADVCKAAKDFMLCATELRWFMSAVYDNGSRCQDITNMVRNVVGKYSLMHIDMMDALPSRQFRNATEKYRLTRDALDKTVYCDGRLNYARVQTVLKDGWLNPVRVMSVSPGDDRIIPRKNDATLDTLEFMYFRRDLIHSWSLLKRSYQILMRYQFDESEYKRRLAITEEHQNLVRVAVSNLPDVSINDLVELYDNDRRWIETNWMQKEIG